jgi:hypothetical protein
MGATDCAAIGAQNPVVARRNGEGKRLEDATDSSAYSQDAAHCGLNLAQIAVTPMPLLTLGE